VWISRPLELERETLTATTKRLRKPKLIEGPEARENFEKTMKTLFRAPKIDLKKPKKGKD
jgi:hypothetical protein